MKPRYAARTYVPPSHHVFLNFTRMYRYFILQVMMEPAGSSGKKAKTAKGSSVSASDKVYTGRLDHNRRWFSVYGSPIVHTTRIHKIECSFYFILFYSILDDDDGTDWLDSYSSLFVPDSPRVCWSAGSEY